MWESRVLCEISKRRWKSVCDFHGRAISTAVSRFRVGAPPAIESGVSQTLAPVAIVAPTASCGFGLARITRAVRNGVDPGLPVHAAA